MSDRGSDFGHSPKVLPQTSNTSASKSQWCIIAPLLTMQSSTGHPFSVWSGLDWSALLWLAAQAVCLCGWLADRASSSLPPLEELVKQPLHRSEGLH